MRTHLTDTQELLFNKVYDSLIAMKDGEIKELSPLHANYENFCQCLRHFIDSQYDWLNGFSITVNDSWTKIRKDFLN